MHSRLLATTLCLTLAGPVALADEPPPEAKRAFTEGKAAYDHGDYDTALRDFQRAQAIAPAPSLYYNIGMAYERLGRYADAATSFDTYLAQVGAPRTDEERAAQAKVKERAAADRAHAPSTTNAPPPSYTNAPPPPAPPPQQPPPGYAPYYSYAPYPPMMAPVLPVLSRDERIRRAKGQRTTGIVLLAIGGTLLISGSVLADVSATTDQWVTEVGTGVGGAICLIGGVALAIPGAVLVAKGQKALNVEKHTPDDSAATRRAALDLAAPGVRLAQPTLALALPPIRF